MTRLVWGLSRTRTYEVGVDHGVFYPMSGMPVSWPGLIRVDEIYADQEADDEYFEGRKFLTTIGRSEFQARLSTFAAPREFYECDGLLQLAQGFYAANQNRSKFNFSYRTLVGSAVQGVDHGYRIHIVYNAVAIPNQISNETRREETSPIVREWTIKTIPFYKHEYVWFTSPNDYKLNARGPVHGPVSHIVIDSLSVNPQNLAILEQLLYGTDTTEPELPTPSEIIEIMR
jgi:hypothetical protein